MKPTSASRRGVSNQYRWNQADECNHGRTKARNSPKEQYQQQLANQIQPKGYNPLRCKLRICARKDFFRFVAPPESRFMITSAIFENHPWARGRPISGHGEGLREESSCGTGLA